MSTSLSCETWMRELAKKLHDQAYELERAADVLQILREKCDYKTEIQTAKEWAKDWLK